MGSYKWGYRVFLKGSRGSIGFKVWRVVIGGVISRVTIVITQIRGLTNPHL